MKQSESKSICVSSIRTPLLLFQNRESEEYYFLKIMIAAVLILLLVFSGTAAAAVEPYNATTWNALSDGEVPTSGEFKFSDSDPTSVIYPKFNKSTGFTPTGNLVLDFSDYRGTFAGEPAADSNMTGALFGNVTHTVGQLNFTIKNLSMASVNVTDSSSNKYFGSIVGYFKGKSNTESFLRFENCFLENCSVYAGVTNAGGLVGYVDSTNVSVCNCHLLHCDIISNNGNVGGIIGYAYSTNVNARDCTVANCTIASTESYHVGGIIGYASTANSISITSCNVENTLIYAGNGYVGGLVGGLVGHVRSVKNLVTSNVTNCVIASGSDYAGGLVGYVISASLSKIFRNSVRHCTVAGSSNVGGLVGNANSEEFKGGSNENKVEFCAVNGSTNTNLVCGNMPSAELGCNPSVMQNFIHNETYHDTITLYRKESPMGALSDADVKTSFHYTIFNATGFNVTRFGDAVFQVTVLGQYGTAGGYGVVTKHTVSVEPGVAGGTIKVNGKDSDTVQNGQTVTVSANPLSGYHLNQTYWKKTNYDYKVEISEGSFTTPGYDVIVSGDFKANVTNVTFYNLTIPIESKLNTYKETVNSTPTVPTRTGYTFAGWIVSSDAGIPFNSINYNNNGIWNYTGKHGGNLSVYANWTVNIYRIDNSSVVNGTVITDCTEASAGTMINITAYNTTAGYHFDKWNVTNSAGGEISVLDNKFMMPADNVGVSADFVGNITNVTFFNVDGEISDSKLNTYGELTNTTSKVLTRTGYTFAGWNVSSDAGISFNSVNYNNTGTWNYAGEHGGNLSVYANWTVNKTTITFNNESADGGTTPADTIVAYNTVLSSVTDVPTKTGNIFGGWYNETGGAGTMIINSSGYYQEVAGYVDVEGKWINESPAITLYANWTADTYIITLDANGGSGGTMSSIQAVYGADMPLLTGTPPSIHGYAFSGYYDINGKQYYNYDGTSANKWDKPNSAALYAKWTIWEKEADAAVSCAEFHYENYTIMKCTDIITDVRLEDVSGISRTPVIFNATDIVEDIPELYTSAGINYQKEGDTITIFNITAAASGPSKINITLIFTDAVTAEANMDKLFFWHHTGSAWEKLESIHGDIVDNEVLYSITTYSFSPFGISIHVPNLPPRQISSESRNNEASVWLTTAAESTPVQTVTTEPAQVTPVASLAKPVQTSVSPSPFAGILFGLLAAALFVLRKK